MTASDSASDPRAVLSARLDALAALVDAANADEDVVELDQQRVGRLSRMDAMQAQAMAGATDARRARERRRLRQALVRVDAGSYGLCMECDKPIPAGRLAIDPAAERCVSCASAAAE